MESQRLKEELVRVVHHEVRQHFIRQTGSDVRCWVTSDLSAVVGQVDVPNGIMRFAIPVVVTEEFYGHANVAAAPDPATERTLG